MWQFYYEYVCGYKKCALYSTPPFHLNIFKILAPINRGDRLFWATFSFFHFSFYGRALNAKTLLKCAPLDIVRNLFLLWKWSFSTRPPDGLEPETAQWSPRTCHWTRLPGIFLAVPFYLWTAIIFLFTWNCLLLFQSRTSLTM